MHRWGCLRRQNFVSDLWILSPFRLSSLRDLRLSGTIAMTLAFETTMKRLFAILGIAIMLWCTGTQSAAAAIPDDVQKLLDTNDCPVCILSGANLQEKDLQQANLKIAVLAQANLKGANLSGANLVLTDMGSADLAGALLADAQMNGANLNQANLSRADLSHANLSNANLAYADFSLGGGVGAAA